MAWIVEKKVNSDASLSQYFMENIFQRSANNEDFIKNCALNNDEIYQIEERTKSQCLCPDWLSLRILRITASNFGAVIKAIKRNSYPPSLIKTLKGTNLYILIFYDTYHFIIVLKMAVP